MNHAQVIRQIMFVLNVSFVFWVQDLFFSSIFQNIFILWVDTMIGSHHIPLDSAPWIQSFCLLYFL